MGELKRLLRYLGPYRKDLLIGALLVVVETCFELVIPVLMADLIDVGVANQDIDYVLHKGGQMGICALCALVTGLLYARFAARASYGWGAQVRRAQFAQVQRYSFANLDHFDAASLVTRMTTDVTVLQNAINGGFRPLVLQSYHAGDGSGIVVLDERPAGCDFYRVRTRSGSHSLLHRAEGSAYVWQASKGSGPAEQCGAGEPDSHPGSEGLCPGRGGGGALSGGQQPPGGHIQGDLPLGGAESAFFAADYVYCHRAYHVVWRKHDPGRRPFGGRPDGISQLCVSGHELHDDALKRIFTAHPVSPVSTALPRCWRSSPRSPRPRMRSPRWPTAVWTLKEYRLNTMRMRRNMPCLR